ncbi:MAG: MBL fold metallo-hydrolase [Tissierellales bacterium]|nr:MBL fold metallo-hydrolase [Tissierellales bacterium]MBN2826539.1 MBL fold metallo-hydrolase [Tissierellales bacterium]
MKIKFTGATGVVTGSCHYIEYDGKKILLDCGLFQGKKEIEQLNENNFPFNPEEIDYLILSHAHIDHSGRIPLLVKKGFKGKIYASNPTYDLCTIMLMDSAHIHETEAEWKSVKAMRKGGDPVEPLYTSEDAQKSLSYFKPILYEQYEEIDELLTIRFTDAGHILGSSIVELWFKEDGKTTKVVFSGDIGMKNKPIIRDPAIVEKADYLIIESTYGNRLHESPEERVEKLAETILSTIKNRGTVVIPSFAVGRTQEIIYELNQHYDGESEFKREFSKIPVYIDSPLASKATEIFKKNADVFDEEARERIFSGDNPLEFKNLRFTQTVEESKALNLSNEPKVIISASGMCNAGRIRHHLKHNLWKKNSTVIFVGYQAEGTLGRTLKDGVKEVRIFGEDISVKSNIVSIEGFSGHADKDGLLEWISGFKELPKAIFIVHGEEESRKEFSESIQKIYNVETIIPKMNSEYEIKENHIEVINQGTSVEEFLGIEVKKSEQTRKKALKHNLSTRLQSFEKPDETIIDTVEKENDELVGKEKINALLEEIIELQGLSTKTLEVIEQALKNSTLNVGDYKEYKNLLIMLEKLLINLTMKTGE